MVITTDGDSSWASHYILQYDIRLTKENITGEQIVKLLENCY
jgi:hypothetical protein